MKRINLLAAGVFIACLGWLMFGLDRQGRADIQARVLGFFTPIFKAEQGAARAGDVAHSRRRGPADMLAEIEGLQGQLSLAQVDGEEVIALREENDRLRSMLNFVERSENDLIPARVIKRTASNWWSTFVIDKGAADGISPDSPVRNEVGLIGKTAQVSEHSSVVILLTDEKCRVSARVEGTRERGILQGMRGGAESAGILNLGYLSKDIDIPEGRRVYSAGGAVFTPNILLGTISGYESREINGEASVAPAVDFATVRDVFVIQPVRSETQEGEEGAATAASTSMGGTP